MRTLLVGVVFFVNAAIGLSQESVRANDKSQERIERLIRDLDSPKWRDRDSATRSLLKVGEPAYPQLLRCVFSGKLEAARRAEVILAKGYEREFQKKSVEIGAAATIKVHGANFWNGSESTAQSLDANATINFPKGSVASIRNVPLVERAVSEKGDVVAGFPWNPIEIVPTPEGTASNVLITVFAPPAGTKKIFAEIEVLAYIKIGEESFDVRDLNGKPQFFRDGAISVSFEKGPETRDYLKIRFVKQFVALKYAPTFALFDANGAAIDCQLSEGNAPGEFRLEFERSVERTAQRLNVGYVRDGYAHIPLKVEINVPAR